MTGLSLPTIFKSIFKRISDPRLGDQSKELRMRWYLENPLFWLKPVARRIPVTVRLPLQRMAPKRRSNEVNQEGLEKSTANGHNMAIMECGRE